MWGRRGEYSGRLHVIGHETRDTWRNAVRAIEFEDLLACARGELFGPGNAQLPLPPMLMVDRIATISETGGAHGKGQIVAELKVAGNDRLDWLFACHFKGDPVMPGCLGLDALWQIDRIFSGLARAYGTGPGLRRRRGQIHAGSDA